MANRESYAGLCVGGPLAGKSIAHPSQRLQMEQFQRMPLKEAPEASVAADIAPAEPFVYNWHHTGAQGFWIPQGETLHDAINALATAYMEKCNGGR